MPEGTTPDPGPTGAEPDATAEQPRRAPEPPAGGAGDEGAQSTPIIDAMQDLAQTTVDYVRTQIEDIMREKIVLPAQKLGFTLASATAAAFLFALGVGFIAVGLLILLAHFITWPGALCLIGAVLVIGAGIFTYLKVRSMQHEFNPEQAGEGKPLAPADAPGTPPRDPRGTQAQG